jgi:hypothetical protein
VELFTGLVPLPDAGATDNASPLPATLNYVPRERHTGVMEHAQELARRLPGEQRDTCAVVVVRTTDDFQDPSVIGFATAASSGWGNSLPRRPGPTAPDREVA